MSRRHVTTTLNGEEVDFLCEPQHTLLDVLRDELHLTGTKEGCGTGDCGACSVIFDGRLICSCLALAIEAEGATVETVEGIAKNGELHPLQRRFLEDAAKVTGGRVWRVRKEDDLPARFLDVLDDIRSRYVLSYSPTGVDTPGWHDLEVKLTGARGDVLARPAYFRPRRATARE